MCIASRLLIVVVVPRLRRLLGKDEINLPGKLKAWIFQHGLLPRLLWPLQIYKVTFIHVETIQCHVNKYPRKWLGVPPSFTFVGMYNHSVKVQPPISSMVDLLRDSGPSGCEGD